MKSSDERKTPRKVFDRLNFVFQFDLDPCTSEDNPLCMPYFYTAADDGLSKSWQGRRAFVNPPYSKMLDWAAKAVRESCNGAFVAFILPNDCSTEAFKILRAMAWGRCEIPHRVKFETPEGKMVDVARSHVVFFLGGLS